MKGIIKIQKIRKGEAMFGSAFRCGFSTVKLGVLGIIACWSVVLSEESQGEGTLVNKYEGRFEAFLREPFFEKQMLFVRDGQAREPYLAVAVDGTVLAMQNMGADFRQPGAGGHLRRSQDGGESWGKIIETPFGFLDSNMVVDETTGEILAVRLWGDADMVFRSRDHGETWQSEEILVRPNEVMRWLAETALMTRSSRSDRRFGESYFMHANASESGVTLRNGQKKGRLIVPATFRPHSRAHPSDRVSIDMIFNCAIFSDDGGATWQVSDFFPKGNTEEGSLTELSDGRIYYNSRGIDGYFDDAFRRELAEEETFRRTAWSYDGGRSWTDLEISRILPDGGGYGRGYGMKGGLVRLPITEKDVLLYSNADTSGGDRERMTVWASFDGAKTWPIKRLVYEGPSAYSSLGAGRPNTPSEGLIFLLFEGGDSHRYDWMQVARFNLSWVLEGELTGDGEVPEWTAK